MDILGIILVCAIIASTLAGLAVGLVKGFTRVATWGGEFLLSAVMTMLVGLIAKSAGVSAGVGGITVIVCAILFVIAFLGLSNLLTNLFEKSLERRADNLRTPGATGVFNRLFGGFTVAAKGLVLSSAIVLFVLTALDLSRVSAIYPPLDEILAGTIFTWLKPSIFDFFIVAMIFMAIREGYTSGISSAVWGIIVCAMIVGAGFGAYNVVYQTTLFNGAAESLAAHLSEPLASVEGMLSGMQMGMIDVAKWIITAGVFLVFLVAVILIAVFVPRILNIARRGKTFYVIDGILGATVVLLLVLAILLFVGNTLWQFADMEFMSCFNTYFGGSTVGIYFYTNNVIAELGGGFVIAPLRQFFV